MAWKETRDTKSSKNIFLAGKLTVLHFNDTFKVILLYIYFLLNIFLRVSPDSLNLQRMKGRFAKKERKMVEALADAPVRHKLALTKNSVETIFFSAKRFGDIWNNFLS